MNTSQEKTQRTGPLGDAVKKPVPTPQDPEGWRFYKPGLEINNHGQLRTVPTPFPSLG